MESIELTQASSGSQEIVWLVGDIDLMTSGEAIEKLTAAATVIEAPRVAVLDLSGVGFMSALGARALCSFNRACALRGVCTYWVAPHGSEARNMLDLIGLSDIIPTFDSLEHARQGQHPAQESAREPGMAVNGATSPP